jgi:tyrosyl-tRNA synthetase
MPSDEIATMEQQIEAGVLRPEEAKRRLAEEVVRMYHGPDAAGDARSHFDRVFKQHESPAEIDEVDVPAACVSDGRVDVPCLLESLGFATSKGDARRKIEQGGVRVGDTKIDKIEIAADDVRGKILRVGKLHFAKLR